MKWETMIKTTAQKKWREGCLSGKFKRGLEVTKDDLRRSRENLLAEMQRAVHRAKLRR